MRKGCCRARLLELQQRLQRSGGRTRKKGADSESTGLTGSKGGLTGPTGLTGSRTGLTGAPSKSGNSSKIKTRPSFKELLAKYEMKGSAQRQKGRPSKVKDTGSSSRHQEQSSRGNYTLSSGPIAPWYCWYPYFYTPMDYSRMHMQSYYIQYLSIYPNHASPQKPIVANNNLVKHDVGCSKAEDCETRFKVFAAEVMSFRLVSYSEVKTVTSAQKGVNGATSGGYARKVN